MWPSQGFWVKDIYLKETGKQRPNFEENRVTKTILGNREHKKIFFDFEGTLGNKPIYFREKGTGTPLGGPNLLP